MIKSFALHDAPVNHIAAMERCITGIMRRDSTALRPWFEPLRVVLARRGTSGCAAVPGSTIGA